MRELLTFKSDFSVKEDISDANEVFSSNYNVVQSQAKESMWYKLIRLPSLQSFFQNEMYFLSLYHHDFLKFQAVTIFPCTVFILSGSRTFMKCM